MKREGRGGKRVSKNLGDRDAPDGLYAWMKRYLESLQVRNYSERTVRGIERYLSYFLEWCAVRSIERPQEVTKPILEQYQRHLFHYRRPNGKPLTFRSQLLALSPLRGYFKWLTRQNVLLWNPASELDLPRPEKRLPDVLTEEEVERVLAQPDVQDPLGVRDRAMLETLYSTAIRRRELIQLGVSDVDIRRGTLLVRQGKGAKDRVVPIGGRAIAWIGRYLDDARPGLVVPPDCGAMFISLEGDGLSGPRVSEMVRQYLQKAEVGKRGSCHLFRHTCATLMLEGGADVRYIQELLGHVELTSTQIYTHVSIRQLKAVHELTHPANVDRREAAKAVGSAPRAVDASTEVLLSSLAAEAATEEDERG